jgi:hypothetical protein
MKKRGCVPSKSEFSNELLRSIKTSFGFILKLKRYFLITKERNVHI